MNSTRALQTKLYDFQNTHQSEDELLIVYYGGHADADRRRGRSIWAANRKPDSPTLTWSSLQHLLENAIPHVFIILDCCYAANAARDTSEGTTKEIIAACGRENPTLGVGERSFTSALIEELQAFGSQPFTVTMLHSRLITMRWRLAFTPVYALLSEHGGHSIELAPQSAPARASGATLFIDEANPEVDEDMMDISAPEARIASDTRVLLSVSISDDATCDIAEWKEWLTHKAPRIVTQIGVKVEAVFKSHSTMLMTSLPIVVWDCLPDKAAYRFMGFVKSKNLDRTHPCSDEECRCLAATVSEQQSRLFEVEKQMQFLESEVMSTLEKMVKNRGATDVDELYKLRLQVNQQLKALELMKKPRSVGGVEVGDSSTQGQADDPLPETRKQRLSAIQGGFTAEGSDIPKPDSSSDSPDQSTLGVIETEKQPANYAISSVFKDDQLPYTQSAVQIHGSDTRMKSRGIYIPPIFRFEVMTGHGNTISPTADDPSKGLLDSTKTGSLQSFDTPAVPYSWGAEQSPTIIEGIPGSGSSSPKRTAATLGDGTERVTLPSKRKRSQGETVLTPLSIPIISLKTGEIVSSVRFSCQRCLHYQIDEIPLDLSGRAYPIVELWCEQCHHRVVQNVDTNEHSIQRTTMLQNWQQQLQETSSNHTKTKTLQNDEEKKDTQPLFAQTLPLTFLVAVHNEYIRQLLLTKLAALGYADIYEAFDGKEAVQKFARSHFTRGHPEKPINIVLLDPLLSMMNGYEATRNILALWERRGQFTPSNKREDDNAGQAKSGVTVLAVSGDTSGAARKRAMAVGMKGFITPKIIKYLDKLLLKYCTGHQTTEGQENDSESYVSNSGYAEGETKPQPGEQENQSSFRQQRNKALPSAVRVIVQDKRVPLITNLIAAGIEPPRFRVAVRDSDESETYPKCYLKATPPESLPARRVTHTALATLQEQEAARGPSTLWGGTSAVSRLGQGPVLDDWDESKLEELATAYMNSRENMWRIIASKLGKEWSTVEEKVSNLLASVQQSLLTKISQCFEKGIEELSRLIHQAQSRTHAFFHGDVESSSLNDKRTIASYTDSAIGMD
ncbi:MAG: hypothetical protein Q9215_006898 [Flavoplaca cf. flavocitrina]